MEFPASLGFILEFDIAFRIVEGFCRLLPALASCFLRISVSVSCNLQEQIFRNINDGLFTNELRFCELFVASQSIHHKCIALYSMIHQAARIALDVLLSLQMSTQNLSQWLCDLDLLRTYRRVGFFFIPFQNMQLRSTIISSTGYY